MFFVNNARCDRWCVEANSKMLYDFLKQTKEKLFEVAEKFPVEFLRGFFDSEGCVSWNEKSKTLVIDVSNYDKDVLRDLLGSFGIHPKIYNYNSDPYSLRITAEGTFPTVSQTKDLSI